MPTLDSQVYAVSLAATVNNALTKQNVAAPLAVATTYQMTSGTGSAQADRLYAAQRTIAASGTDTLDLAGVLTDAVGTTLTFARVKGLYIYAYPANTNNVIVGNGGVNSFINWVGAAAHTVTVRPGGLLLLVAPDATAYAVTAGTGDILQVANSGAGTPVTYDVVIWGSST